MLLFDSSEAEVSDWGTPINAKCFMSFTQEEKQSVIKEYALTDADTGSSEVQIAILSKRIVNLTEHFKSHKKDHSSRRGLIKLVNKRRRLMGYLKKKNTEGYASLIKKLGIRG